MSRILLVEPDYKNKYPPLGLMKISTFHKSLGDDVYFVKGNDPYFKNQKWDRIYITTLFTFYWDKTIKCIEYYKNSANLKSDIFVGGVMATVLKDKLEETIDSDINILTGLLDEEGMKHLGIETDFVVDNMIPDYDILETIDYEYPTSDSYIGYMTRGCVRKCKFCAVPTLEPTFKSYIPIRDQIKYIDQNYGQKRHLLLLDNNVLGSKNFFDIIDEIKDLGFAKNAKMREENLFPVYINRIKANKDDYVAIKHLKKICGELIFKLAKKASSFQGKLATFELESIQKIGFDLDFRIFPASNDYSSKISSFVKLLLTNEELIGSLHEKYRNKATKSRYIDFNQGIDARLLGEANMQKLSEVNIRPLRIAFDEIKYKNIYEEKVRLAARYGIVNLSNYILYNYHDTPEDLYERLKINIELNEELGIKIYSFPMKFMPLEDTDRKHIGMHWNKKYLRSVQVILNAVHGAVMPGASFFKTAFGSSVEDFKKILLMPEDYILNRLHNLKNGNIERWWSDFEDLKSQDETLYALTKQTIESNDFSFLDDLLYDKSSLTVIEHYLPSIAKTVRA